MGNIIEDIRKAVGPQENLREKADSVREELQKRLPYYMIPAYFTKIDSVPVKYAASVCSITFTLIPNDVLTSARNCFTIVKLINTINTTGTMATVIVLFLVGKTANNDAIPETAK